jgi:hypothetical protein
MFNIIKVSMDLVLIREVLVLQLTMDPELVQTYAILSEVGLRISSSKTKVITLLGH